MSRRVRGVLAAVLVTIVVGLAWAGTATATEWRGYVEGALESGDRASHEVLTALRG